MAQIMARNDDDNNNILMPQLEMEQRTGIPQSVSSQAVGEGDGDDVVTATNQEEMSPFSYPIQRIVGAAKGAQEAMVVMQKISGDDHNNVVLYSGPMRARSSSVGTPTMVSSSSCSSSSASSSSPPNPLIVGASSAASTFSIGVAPSNSVEQHYKSILSVTPCSMTDTSATSCPTSSSHYYDTENNYLGDTNYEHSGHAGTLESDNDNDSDNAILPSTVLFGDEGAEVTVDLSLFNLNGGQLDCDNSCDSGSCNDEDNESHDKYSRKQFETVDEDENQNIEVDLSEQDNFQMAACEILHILNHRGPSGSSSGSSSFFLSSSSSSSCASEKAMIGAGNALSQQHKRPHVDSRIGVKIGSDCQFDQQARHTANTEVTYMDGDNVESVLPSTPDRHALLTLSPDAHPISKKLVDNDSFDANKKAAPWKNSPSIPAADNSFGNHPDIIAPRPGVISVLGGKIEGSTTTASTSHNISVETSATIELNGPSTPERTHNRCHQNKPPSTGAEKKVMRQRATSLLDTDQPATLSPSPTQIHRVNTNTALSSPQPSNFLVAGICCGTVGYSLAQKTDLTGCGTYSNDIAGLEQMEAKISKFLSDPLQSDAWCHDWHAWSYFGYTPSEEQPFEAKEDIKQVLRNRAFDISARRRRLRALRKDLSPFSNSPQRDSDIKINKAKSFCITEHASAIARVSKQRQSRSSLFVSQPSRKQENDDTVSSKLVSMWESIPSCSNAPRYTPHSPEMIRSPLVGALGDSIIDEDDVYYDSDPEDFIRRPRESKQTGVCTTEPPGASSGFVDWVNKENLYNLDTKVHHHSNKRDKKSRRNRKTMLNHSNAMDADIGQLVQEFLNEKFTLILHDGGNNIDASASCKAIAITAWFERGQQLSRSILQPRLMWQSVNGREQSVKLGRKNIIRPDCMNLHTLDLIDISRILAVDMDEFDRTIHPFVKPKRSFIIKTIDQSFLFETCTQEERDRIVYMLKLVVARLVSKLLIGDETFVEEFFTHISNTSTSSRNSSRGRGKKGGENEREKDDPRSNHYQGPGEAPYWTQANV